MPLKHIYVVGVGLDGAAGITQKAQQVVKQATLLVGSHRHLSYFPNHPAPRLVLADLHQLISQLKQYLAQGELIVVLVSGDPLFFGLGRLLLREFRAHQLEFYPHLSSIQLAFSKIKVPWQDAQIISLHGRSLEQLTVALKRGVEKIALLTDTHNTPAAIARHYLALDIPSHYQFWVGENLGCAQEQINCFWAQELSQKTFAPLNVVVLLRQENYREVSSHSNDVPILGLPDAQFLSFPDRPGLMTKREARIMILAELALRSEQIVWDIGAGTGSVAIEIARLCPQSQIYAIEKTALGISLIQQNCQRLQVQNVTAVHGSAPEALQKLPVPKRIFIGGSGGNLSQILTVCEGKIAVDGLIVLSLATLEHLQVSLDWFKTHNWHYRLLQLQISRSVPIAELTRFSPLNPVITITATRY